MVPPVSAEAIAIVDVGSVALLAVLVPLLAAWSAHGFGSNTGIGVVLALVLVATITLVVAFAAHAVTCALRVLYRGVPVYWT